MISETKIEIVTHVTIEEQPGRNVCANDYRSILPRPNDDGILLDRETVERLFAATDLDAFLSSLPGISTDTWHRHAVLANVIKFSEPTDGNAFGIVLAWTTKRHPAFGGDPTSMMDYAIGVLPVPTETAAVAAKLFARRSLLADLKLDDRGQRERQEEILKAIGWDDGAETAQALRALREEMMRRLDELTKALEARERARVQAVLGLAGVSSAQLDARVADVDGQLDAAFNAMATDPKRLEPTALAKCELDIYGAVPPILHARLTAQ